jgi:hypothetical protein
MHRPAAGGWPCPIGQPPDEEKRRGKTTWNLAASAWTTAGAAVITGTGETRGTDALVEAEIDGGITGAIALPHEEAHRLDDCGPVEIGLSSRERAHERLPRLRAHEVEPRGVEEPR